MPNRSKLTKAESKHALTILTRLARRRRNEASLLMKALEGRWQLLQPVLEVALETGDPIGRILAQVITDKATPPVIARLESLLSTSPDVVELWEVRAVVAEQRFQTLRAAIKKAGFRNAATKAALAAEILSYRLRNLGRYEAAYAAAEESFRLRSLLAGVKTDRHPKPGTR